MHLEGELPFSVQLGRVGISLHLRSVTREWAFMESRENKWYIYLGKYQDFDDFSVSNLKEIDGW